MEGQRTLTIGITVNLENYENLRLEVNGPVNSERDADELISFLDSILQKFGQGDPSSKERVETFRRRILFTGPKTGAKETEAVPAAEYGMPAECKPAVPPGAFPAQDNAVKPTPADPGNAEGVFPCEECGSPVKPAEQKMSMLFAGRTLCRKCLKKV